MTVTDALGRLLMERRLGTGHAPGEWCLPGGKVNDGSTVQEAMRTALKDETGRDCLDAEFLFHQHSLPLAPGGMPCINGHFRCRPAGKLVLSQESNAVAWVGRGELGSRPLAFRNHSELARCWPRTEPQPSTDPERVPNDTGPSAD